ncbi:MAG: hypothetical protein AAFY26_09735 [Cyanobacteria bacterium J06638_22]
MHAKFLDLTHQLRDRLAPKSPVYVFHHIPKCGGTSLNQVLEDWFTVVRDYRVGFTDTYPPKADLAQLRSTQCLCGHFELEGQLLHQRYPEVWEGDRYHVFTFIRHPLDLQLSLFRYAERHNPKPNRTLEKHLVRRPNYIASLLDATPDNYKAVLDRYFFIGVLEHGQESVDRLAQMLGKPTQTLPWSNQTRSPDTPKKRGLTREQIVQFRQANALDYRIYRYCLNKFEIGG